MSNSVTPSICIITPSHRGDIGQFSVLRRSIKIFAPDFQHLAIVNSEDCDGFRDRFRGDANLEIVKSSDVLPRSVEHRRRRSGPRWLTGKWLNGPRISGWHAQKLMKVYTLVDCRREAAVFMDSDVFICRPLAPEYFFVGGQLKLFRRRAVNAEALYFDITTHEILGNPLHQITELYDYIFSPTCFRRSSAIRLFAELKRRRGSSWLRRFVEHRRPSEYNLLGYAATVLEGAAGYHLLECNPDDLHHSIRYPEDRAAFSAEIEKMRAQPKSFALIQSSLEIDLEQISDAFEQVAEAHKISVSAETKTCA